MRELIVDDYKNFKNDSLFNKYIYYFFESFGAKKPEKIDLENPKLLADLFISSHIDYRDPSVISLEDMTFENFKRNVVSERIKKIY